MNLMLKHSLHFVFHLVLYDAKSAFGGFCNAIILTKEVIQFCLRNEISDAETFKMIKKAFWDHVLSEKNVYFEESCESVEDREQSGRLPINNTSRKPEHLSLSIVK